VIHPASTIYRECTERERITAGVTDDLLRISVGIESERDIIGDFERALKEA
jgi:O-acetylhomoserine/O-acetylserine sulfhydrylase-like pyridoxal-dependent enzyme